MKGQNLLFAYLNGDDITEYLLDAVKEHMLTGKRIDEILGIADSNRVSPRRRAFLQRRGQCLLAAFYLLKSQHNLSDRQTCILLYDAINSENESGQLGVLVDDINLCGAFLHINWTSADSLYNTITNALYDNTKTTIKFDNNNQH